MMKNETATIQLRYNTDSKRERIYFYTFYSALIAGHSGVNQLGGVLLEEGLCQIQHGKKLSNWHILELGHVIFLEFCKYQMDV